MKDFFVKTILAMSIVVFVFLLFDIYIKNRKKKRSIVWNFCRYITNAEINAVIDLIKEQGPNIDLNVMVVIYGRKWQMRLFEWSYIARYMIERKSKRLTEIEQAYAHGCDNILGTYLERERIITVSGYNFKKEPKILQKFFIVRVIVHELYHHHLSVTSANLDEVNEEIEIFNSELNFIKRNLTKLNEIFNLGEEVECVKDNYDKDDLDVISEAYKKIYGEQSDIEEA